MMKHNEKIWAIIPAAGIGARMTDVSAQGNFTNNDKPFPKQYLRLHNKTLLEHSIEALVAISAIENVTVAVSADDDIWQTMAISKHASVKSVIGGAERVNSVLAALKSLMGVANDRDWVLVHDAARPCVDGADIDKLIETCLARNAGAILAAPVVDTIKMVDDELGIVSTVDRRQLFQALTPQMFPYKSLLTALESAIERGVLVTDEASAFEESKDRPIVVLGKRSNIKITYPEDLVLAETILANKNVSI